MKHLLWALVLLAFPGHATEVQVGATYIYRTPSEGWTAVVSESVGRRFQLSLGYISEQTCGCPTWFDGEQLLPREIPENGFFQATRVWRWQPHRFGLEFELGGVYYLNTNRAVVSNLNFAVAASILYGKWSVGWHHGSNAGSREPNLGQDLLLIGYRFGE